jgi:tetratricopeptide (TPR) repeat protein
MSEHELWNELGNLYFLSGAYPQAVHAYNRSIKLDEDFGRPYSNLALTYVQQGRYDEAVDLYRRSIELLAENREKAISWNRLGHVFRYLKDYPQAVVAYRRADELDPDSGDGRDEPGWLSDPDGEARPADRGRPADSEGTSLARTDGVVPVVTTVNASPTSDASDLSTATWEIAQATTYQQDLSETLEPASLATWGTPEVDADWPLDPETEIYPPDVESDDLTRWLPIPEPDTRDQLEFTEDESPVTEVDELFDEEAANQMPDAVDDPTDEPSSGAAVGVPFEAPAQAEAPSGLTIAAPLPANGSTQSGSEYPAPSVRKRVFDVIVEERGATDFVVASEAEGESAGLETIRPVAAERPSNATGGSEITSSGPKEATGPERDAEDLREIEAGIAKFQRVVQLNPRNAHAWDALGNLYKSAGLYKEALMAYEQAISNDPSKAMYHHHLGLVYACEGRTEDAIDAFQRVIEIDPDHSLAHATLGGYYRKMGLEELAQKHVGKVMKSIFDSENEYNRACLAAICGNTDQALELLRVALKNKQTYVDWILRDPDLDFIRQDPRFKQLISDYAR